MYLLVGPHVVQSGAFESNCSVKPTRLRRAAYFRSLARMQTPSQHIPATVKVLAVLMTLVVSGIGVLAVATHYAPARSTRYGILPALQGAQADAFGVTIFFVGLLPLGLLLGSARRAAWFGCIVGLLVLVSLFIGAR